MEEKIDNPYKRNRVEEINRSRSGIFLDTLTSVDIAERVKYAEIFLEVFDGFFCHNVECVTYTDSATEMFEKRDFPSKR